MRMDGHYITMPEIIDALGAYDITADRKSIYSDLRDLAGVIIDRFGKNVMMIPEDEAHFTVNVDVHVSKQFWDGSYHLVKA